MKAVAIALTLLLALIGGGVVLLGGGALFVASSIETRSAELEKEMMAQLAADAPYKLTSNQISLFRPQVKKLAELAAKMEFANKFNDADKNEIDTKMGMMSKAIAAYDPTEKTSDASWDHTDNGSDFSDSDLKIGEESDY